MGLQASPFPHVTFNHGYFKLCSIRVLGRRKTLPFVTTNKRFCSPHGINSIMGTRNFSIHGNEAPEPARDLLERLFVQTQKLEGQINGNSHLDVNVESAFDLENLESDLHAVLEALRKKEEDLQEAEKTVTLENAELNLAREELEQRENKIKAARFKQERLENELRQANFKVLSQARHIEDLKLQLNQRDNEITTAKFEVSSKEDEIDKMKRILTQKNDEAAKAVVELESKSRLLVEVHEVVRKQELELQALQNALQEKELKLEELLVAQQIDEEKVKIAESKLEKQTMEWLLTQEEVKKLGELASKRIGDGKETMEDFQKVKMLLVDVRTELVSSQQSLADSRTRMEERDRLFEKQMLELNEQKEGITSYMNSLKSAHIEVESEKAKLRVAEAQNRELELELSFQRDLMHGLQEELDREKISLEQAMTELSSLRVELDRKNIEFRETSDFLEVKERELVEARLEIQHLKSEQLSLQLVLQERNLELVDARKRLDGLNAEVKKLKILLNGKEEQLLVTFGMLREKEEYTQVMEDELNNAKAKASEAASVVGRIVDFTQEVAMSTKDEDLADKWQKKQLDAELELLRENLREKETELLAAQRELTIKDEELKTILKKLEEKDAKLKELSVYSQGVGGENRVQELANEKRQLEAAQLEVEAATSALQELVEMSRHFLNKATLSIYTDLDVNVSSFSEVDSELNVAGNNVHFAEVKSEVSRLSALTERLVLEASAAI